ncbi:caspase, EACC1-associated type [Amycolatopsis aidingensis]|uniref:caspase, EACC1-associated type n=1 Tax=Amycolatopsis aidingensis TaxID=2842453 RepID=UPI001C0D5AD9|nr:Hsp70 family protein [Amycolatopsis aidingensis]
MRKRALLIANQVYDDPRWTELPGAAGDAQQLAEVLGSRAIGEFDVTVVPDKDARTVRRDIEEFFATAEQDDLLLLHMSCHGQVSATRELHFVARDTESAYLAATGISAQFVNDCIDESRARRTVLLLDCCFSGGYTRGLRQRGAQDEPVVGKRFQGHGKAVITACSALQYAYESTVLSKPAGEPSVFTSAVIEGMSTGLADQDSDGQVSVEDLYRFVSMRVAQQVANQKPELSMDRLSGTIYLARNIRALYQGHEAEPPIPAAIHRAVVNGEPWERFGATLGLERLLDDVQTGNAAREALVPLTRDADEAVAERALAVWREKVGSAVPIAVGLAAERTVEPTSHSVGIDFGTTNSVVAVLVDGRPVVVSNHLGVQLTPSVVTIQGSVVDVGAVAKDQAHLRPSTTIAEVKRALGTGRSFVVADAEYSAENVAAFILDQLRRDAERYLGEPVGDAVITIPAHYGVAERDALSRAARLAGLNAVRMINEPAAAALAAGSALGDKEQTILVFDLGGGTLDVSVVELGEGVVEIRATSGDERLGGSDWDQRLLDWLVELAIEASGVDPRSDSTAAWRLRKEAEKAKIELSHATTARVHLPYLAQADGLPVHLDVTLDRIAFERRTTDLVERCRRKVMDVLRDVGISADEVDLVAAVGGSAALPAISRMLTSLGDSPIPLAEVDPYTAVAVGAALQGGVLKGEVKDVLPLDVTPLSLGIATKGGVFTRLIERNTTLPTKRSEIFTTADDNQTTVAVQVFQGDHDLAEDNKKVGVIELTDLPPVPQGVPQIEVLVDIDANGAVHVTVTDLGSGTRANKRLSEATVMAGSEAAGAHAGLDEVMPTQLDEKDRPAPAEEWSAVVGNDLD